MVQSDPGFCEKLKCPRNVPTGASMDCTEKGLRRNEAEIALETKAEPFA